MKLYSNFIALVLISSVLSCSKTNSEPEVVINQYTLTVSSGTGGTVSSSGGTYEEGSIVNLTATPNNEYIFQNWSNGSTDNPLAIILNQNTILTANFIKRKYPLTINIQGEGTVREEIVSSGKSTPTEYNSGSVVRVTALPSNGWLFGKWSGSVSSTLDQIELEIDDSKTLNVIFEAVPFEKYSSIFGDTNNQQLYIDAWIQDAIYYGRNDLINALDNFTLEGIYSEYYSYGGYALICSENDTVWLHSDFFEDSTYQFGELSSPDLYRIYLLYHEIGHTILDMNHANYAEQYNNSSVITATAGYIPDQYDIMGYPQKNGEGFFRFNPEEWDQMLQRYFNPDQAWIANCENGEVAVALGVGKWKIKKKSLETIQSIIISEETTSKGSNATLNIVVNDLNISLSETSYYDCRDSGDGIYYYFDGNIDGDIGVVLLISAVDGGNNNDGGFIEINFNYPDGSTKTSWIGFRSRVEESVEFIEIVNNQWSVNFNGIAYKTYYNEQGEYVYTDDEILTIVSAYGNCD
ncbi:hypothetical protein N9P98_03940 [Flavobacteriaceae bacterium]|nr:hypothetical protein [Flavobacteriaceae bacterium]